MEIPRKVGETEPKTYANFYVGTHTPGMESSQNLEDSNLEQGGLHCKGRVVRQSPGWAETLVLDTVHTIQSPLLRSDRPCCLSCLDTVVLHGPGGGWYICPSYHRTGQKSLSLKSQNCVYTIFPTSWVYADAVPHSQPTMGQTHYFLIAHKWESPEISHCWRRRLEEWQSS